MSRTTLFTLSTLCLFAASACGPDADSPERVAATKKTKNETEEEKTTMGSCSLLSPSACAAEAGCRVQSATRYEADRVCHHPTEPVECVDARLLCSASFTFAMDTARNTWYFQDGCIPASWRPFQPGAADKAALAGPPCSCGARYNIDKGCRYPAEQRAGCLNSGRPDLNLGNEICLQIVTCRKDSAGNVWVFRDSCIPQPWRYFEQERCRTSLETEEWPLCP